MSRTLRGVLAVLIIASVFLTPTLTTASAKAKPKCPSSKKAKKQSKGKAKKKCAKAKPKPKPKKNVAPGTPVTIDLLDGSYATVTIPSVALPGGYVLPGTPVTRTVTISGRLHGLIPGGYQLGQDNNIVLSDAAITPAPVDLLSDPNCGGAPFLRLNPASNVVLDKSAPSAGKVYMTGKAAATVNALLRLSFDMRNETGCDKPFVTTGIAETLLPVSLEGMIQKETGLAALTLDGPPVQTTAHVCLTPGPADQPCAIPPAGYPITVQVHTIVRVSVG
jgi:hypothetical protein